MGKIRDHFKKIRGTKGTFHAKMGTIKARNGMDLTEVEDIKKRQQEYAELYKKDLHDPDNHSMITHIEPATFFLSTYTNLHSYQWFIKVSFLHNLVNNYLRARQCDFLECKVKWALGSITTNKASGGDGIPVELFQILKDAAAKVLHSKCQQIWKFQQ